MGAYGDRSKLALVLAKFRINLVSAKVPPPTSYVVGYQEPAPQHVLSTLEERSAPSHFIVDPAGCPEVNGLLFLDGSLLK